MAKDGDVNTKIFQSSIRNKQQKPTVSRIKDEEGEWLESAKDAKEAAVSFFKGQLMEETMALSSSLIDNIPQVLTTS